MKKYKLGGLEELIKSPIPEDAVKSMIYQRKKARGLKNTGLCALIAAKEADGTYVLYPSFYKGQL